MEIMKKVEEITEPHPASKAMLTLDDSYLLMKSIEIHDSVPEAVRSYIEAVKSLFVYGWFYYPFYTLAAFLATTAVEMALRMRLPKEGKDSRGLGKLLKQAVSKGLLRDEGFVSLKDARAELASIFEGTGELNHRKVSVPDVSYVGEAVQRLTAIRNEFAHPRGHWIMTPGHATSILILVSEVINQVYPT